MNKSVKIIMTCIAKVSNKGLKDIFVDLEDQATKDLIHDIEEVNFRLNDEVIQEDQCLRDAFTQLYVKEEGKAVKKDDEHVIGISQTMRLTLDQCVLDM